MSAFTCLFVGRFQPFHNGHLMVIKGMTKVCGRIVLAIGSVDAHGTADNPFSAEERKDMIQAALQDADIIPNFDVTFIEVPDMKDDATWTKKCLELAGEVHTVWSGNEHVLKCFKDAGKEVKQIKPVPGISGTEIREKMKTGGDWRKQVPSAVVDKLSAINGVERVKNA